MKFRTKGGFANAEWKLGEPASVKLPGKRDNTSRYQKKLPNKAAVC